MRFRVSEIYFYGSSLPRSGSSNGGGPTGAALAAAMIQASVKLSDLEEMYKNQFGYQLVPEKFGKNSLGELLSEFEGKQKNLPKYVHG